MNISFPVDMPENARKAALYMALISSVINIVDSLDVPSDEIEALEDVMIMLNLDSKRMLDDQHILLTLQELCTGFSRLDLTEITGEVSD